VSKATTAGSVLAAFDTTNLRLTGTVPPSGKIYWKIKSALHGAATYPQCLLGVLSGASVVARAPVMMAGGNLAATTICAIWAEGIITGTPGAAFTYDAAWACETGVASTGIKYGGPNDTTVNNAFGGISFELWDCCPVWTPSSGAAPTTTVSQRIDTIDDFIDTEIAALTTSVGNNTTALTSIQADTDNIQTRLPAALVSGRMDSSVGAMAADVLTAAAAAADFGTEVGTAVWATATRVLTAGTNIALAKGTGVTGFNDLSAAQVNAEVDTGIADAALATAANLAVVAGYLDTEIAAIKNKTDNLPAAPASTGDVTTVGTAVAAVKVDTAAIKLKTDNLPSDPADASVIAGRFDTLDTAVGALVAPDNSGIAAIQAKTDLLTFDGSNVNANTETFNGVAIVGTGGTGDKFRV
jgi:hypothetical protein